MDDEEVRSLVLVLSFTIMALIVLIVLIALGISTQEGSNLQDKKVEAIILSQGKFIRCDVAYFEDFGSGGAKIVSKDGTIYYTNNYTIVENQAE